MIIKLITRGVTMMGAAALCGCGGGGSGGSGAGTAPPAVPVTPVVLASVGKPIVSVHANRPVRTRMPGGAGERRLGRAFAGG